MSYLGQVGVLVVALVGGSFDSGCNDFAKIVFSYEIRSSLRRCKCGEDGWDGNFCPVY
jgi:hypothetical protein